MSRTFSHIGEYLRTQRIAIGLTQASLATRVDVHSQFVSNWERGLCAPPMDKKRKLKSTLKINFEDLSVAAFRDLNADFHQTLKQEWGFK